MSIKAMNQALEALMYCEPDSEENPKGLELWGEAMAALRIAIHARQANRWQSITADEVHEAFNYVEFIKHLDFDRHREAWCEAFAAYIEEKLKEKNQ